MEKGTALVTGSSRGIGRAIALRLARDGWDIAVNYIEHEREARETAEAARALGVRAKTYRADVADRARVFEMFDEARAELGEVRLLVNNAGIAGQIQFQDITPAQWQRFMDVNLGGAFNACQAALGSMLHRHEGCIINISSIWGLRGASCETAYSCTKGALIALTRSLASELAPSGIRVNCIAPGVIDTDMLRTLPDDVLDGLAAETPMLRLGKPEDIAGAAAFFASPEASFITGQVLTADGGFVV